LRFAELICGLPTSENLPPESTTLAVLVRKFTAGVVQNGGKCATGVVDTGSKFPTLVVVPVVYLDLLISPQIFVKLQNDPNVIFRGLGEDDS
jgi:hypothetical protein